MYMLAIFSYGNNFLARLKKQFEITIENATSVFKVFLHFINSA